MADDRNKINRTTTTITGSIGYISDMTDLLPFFEAFYLDREHIPQARLVGGDKGCNVSIASFPGSPALWAGSFTFRGSTLLESSKEASKWAGCCTCLF
jgi:hypothetical protein